MLDALQGMTKLPLRRTALFCITFSVLGCGDDQGSTPAPTGVAGAAGMAPITAGTGIAGASGTGTSAAGSGAAGGAGRAAAGTSGAAAQGGSGGSSAAGSSGAAGAAPAGGSGGAAGSAQGGAGGAGGAGGSAGAAAGSGGSTAGTGTIGRGGVLNETIIVAAGQMFDGKNLRYTAGSGLGDGSQDEGQKPLFKLEKGATLVNVVIGSPAADGIHCHGDATLRNIVWEDIGEDAMTIKESGTVTLDGGSASNGEDKVFQINAASTFKVSNFKASHAGKFIRQNGGTTFKVEVAIDKCDISNMDEAIFRTDSSSSTVSMTNTRYSKIGDSLFIGVTAGNIKTSNNTEY
jgi:pectate lyase C